MVFSCPGWAWQGVYALILKLSAYLAGSLPSHTTPSMNLLVRISLLGSGVFDAALEYICGHDGVWKATGGEILDAYLQVNPAI